MGVACAPGGVAGDFCEASHMRLTRGAGASAEKFGRASGRVGAGVMGLDRAAVEEDGSIGAAAPLGAGGLTRPDAGGAGAEVSTGAAR